MSITIPSQARQGDGPEPAGDGRGAEPAAEPTTTGAPATTAPATAPLAPAAPAVVYLAAAQNTYGTLLYRLALRHLGELWPDAVLMDAASCGFSSRADWQLRWPFIREGIDGLVVLSEADGTVSRDTWLELRDATDLGVPSWSVTRSGSLVPVSLMSFRLYPKGSRSVRRWARVELAPGG